MSMAKIEIISEIAIIPQGCLLSQPDAPVEISAELTDISTPETTTTYSIWKGDAKYIITSDQNSPNYWDIDETLVEKNIFRFVSDLDQQGWDVKGLLKEVMRIDKFYFSSVPGINRREVLTMDIHSKDDKSIQIVPLPNWPPKSLMALLPSNEEIYREIYRVIIKVVVFSIAVVVIIGVLFVLYSS